jgi:hypothetical protein
MVRPVRIAGIAVHRLATLAVLSALLLRALVPAGMMPDFNRAFDGDFRLVICTGHGPQTIEDEDLSALLAAGQQDKSGRSDKAPSGAPDHGPQLCPFAAALCLLGPVLLVLLFALLGSPERFRPLAGDQRPGRSRDYAPWTARGPPLAFCS